MSAEQVGEPCAADLVLMAASSLAAAKQQLRAAMKAKLSAVSQESIASQS